MNRLVIASAVALLFVTGCSSTKQSGVLPSEVVPVKEQRLATEFKRQGIKIHYTLMGEVEKIESFGYANVWRGEYETVAELDAKSKMVKFLRGETVSTDRMHKVISKSIERAQDNTLNKFRSSDGSISISDIEIDEEAKKNNTEQSDENSRQNTALRKAAVNNAHQVVTTVQSNSSGKLQAVYKDRGFVQDDGKTYVAVYVWTVKHQNAQRFITGIMDAR